MNIINPKWWKTTKGSQGIIKSQGLPGGKTPTILRYLSEGVQSYEAYEERVSTRSMSHLHKS